MGKSWLFRRGLAAIELLFVITMVAIAAVLVLPVAFVVGCVGLVTGDHRGPDVGTST